MTRFYKIILLVASLLLLAASALGLYVKVKQIEQSESIQEITHRMEIYLDKLESSDY